MKQDKNLNINWMVRDGSVNTSYTDSNQSTGLFSYKEKKTNHILDFTREIKKNADEDFKTIIIESLWSIVYSDKESDIYESNLMRRLSGLLYLDNKKMGDIKEKIKKRFTT